MVHKCGFEEGKKKHTSSVKEPKNEENGKEGK
jgi:hypothetical protein